MIAFGWSTLSIGRAIQALCMRSSTKQKKHSAVWNAISQDWQWITQAVATKNNSILIGSNIDMSHHAFGMLKKGRPSMTIIRASTGGGKISEADKAFNLSLLTASHSLQRDQVIHYPRKTTLDQAFLHLG